MKSFMPALVWGTMLLCSAQLGLAGEQAEQEGVMDEVVVTAGRLAESKADQTAHITVITAEDIATSSAQDVGDLLAEKNIGYIKKYPGGLTSVGIRGFRSDTHGNDLRGHILVLLDGRRAGTGNVAKINTKNIERLEIIRGPAAVQYGSAAMGGVVNVITRQGKGDLGAKLSTSFGSYVTRDSSVSFAGSKAKFDYAASVSRSASDDYQDANDETFENTGIEKKDSYSANLGLTFLDGHRLGVILTGYRADDMGNPGYLSRNDLDNYKNSKLYSSAASYAGSTDKMQWLLRYFQGRDRDSWHDPILSNASGWDNGQTAFQETEQQGGQAQASVELPWLTVTAGVDWVDYQMEASWTPQETTYENMAGFMLAKSRLLNDRLIIDAGLRYDDYEVEMKRPVGNREDDSEWTPSAGVAYKLTNELQARVHYGQAFVMPGADQLAADFVSFGVRNIGNPNLKPESSRTWEAGLNYQKQSLSTSLSFFHTSFRDKIETVVVGADSSWDNVGRATLSGIEGEFSFDIGSLFDWSYEVMVFAGFVYHNKYRDEENHRDLKELNKWNAHYGVGVSDLDGFSARINFAYNGEQRVDDWQSGIYPSPAAEMGGFTVANLTVSKGLWDLPTFGEVSLRAEVDNMLDKEYAYVKGYPMPGRLFTLGLDWEY